MEKVVAFVLAREAEGFAGATAVEKGRPMKQFVTEESFWELFPEAQIGIVVAHNMKPTEEVAPEDAAAIARALAEANGKADQHLESNTISQNEVVAVWRDAYQKFKTKKGVRCSIENLLKRVLKGNPVGSITPSVDIYNTVSLTHALPVGGEDIDAMAGDIRLGITEGGDAFRPLGEEEDAPTLEGELCYRDDAGAICRFIARTLLKLKLPLMLALSFAATCLIETAQFTGLSGAYPFAYRTFDVDDLICNTLGSLIGWGLAHLAVRLTQREAEVQPPATHNPGFVRRAVALWTDVMIIDLCAVVPRLMVAAGLRLMTGDAFDEALLALVNGEMWIACYLVAFAVVELVVPWMRDGSTPAGLFYRMSCETRKRAGAARVVFYAERAVVLLLVVAHPLCAGLPLAVFYFFAREMPYDRVPKGWAERVGDGEEASEIPEASRA